MRHYSPSNSVRWSYWCLHPTSSSVQKPSQTAFSTSHLLILCDVFSQCTVRCAHRVNLAARWAAKKGKLDITLQICLRHRRIRHSGAFFTSYLQFPYLLKKNYNFKYHFSVQSDIIIVTQGLSLSVLNFLKLFLRDFCKRLVFCVKVCYNNVEL